MNINISDFFNTTFTINEHLIFTPIDRSLCNTTSGSCVYFQTPASLCLLILLINHGVLVDKETIINHSWGYKNPIAVSNNTFYQMLTHLRKTLTEAGCGDIIKTIPRRGLLISKEISIIINNSSEDTKLITEQLTPNDTAISYRKNKPLFKQPNFFLLLSVILLIAGLVLSFFDTQKTFFSDYVKITKAQCNVIYNSKLTNEQIKDILSKEDCSSSKTIFISNSTNALRNSIIRCSVYTKFIQKCYSELIINQHTRELHHES